MNRKIFTLCAAAAVLLVSCGKERQETPVQKISIRTARPEQRVFLDVTATQGVIEPVDHATLSAMVPGRLEVLAVKEGDHFKKGQLLFRSDRKNLLNRQTLAQEALNMAKLRCRVREADTGLSRITFEKAAKDFKRAEDLYHSHAVSQTSFESSEVAWRKAKLAIEQAEATLATAKEEVDFAEATLRIATKHLEDSDVFAPYDGVVTAKLRNENEFCNVGTPVLKIERPAAKRICVLISGLHYAKVRTGKTVLAVSFGGKELCRVPVTIVDRTIDPVSRTFTLKGELPADLPLPSGTLCDVTVVFAERRSEALPEDSVLYRPDGKFTVFEVRNGLAHEIPVKTGLSRNGFTEIADPAGVKGKEIIVSGQYFVSEGTPVTVIPAK